MEARILVPLDGSAVAEAILPAAANLARITGGALTLLRVVSPPPALDPFGLVPAATLTWTGLPAALNVARHYLDAVAEDLRDPETPLGAPGAVPVQIEAVPGDPAATIVDYAAQRPSVQWIAMATHGRSGIARWLYGSVAEQVLQTTDTPVLLLRPAPSAEAPPLPGGLWHHIVVPLDGSPLAERALAQARMLAVASGATLALVTALSLEANVPQITAYLETTAGQLRAEGVDVQTYSRFGEPAPVILQVAQEVQAGLIVMTTPGPPGSGPTRVGNVAMQTIHSARQPVLLVRSNAPAQAEHPTPAAVRA
jgi:nucleotide-binding universal stress UspA family protein